VVALAFRRLAMSDTILAIDPRRHKRVACVYDRRTGGALQAADAGEDLRRRAEEPQAVCPGLGLKNRHLTTR
jgi:hypothetical protein